MSLNGHRRWELLTSLMTDGFYVLQDYRFVYVNAAFERIVGVQPGELIGQKFTRFVHPDMRELVQARYEDRIKGRDVPKHYEITILKADGKSSVDAWFEIDMVKDDNQEIAVAGTVRDIGSLKSLKNELDDTKGKLHSIMDNMSDTIYQTNMEGEITLISGTVESLLGYTEQEMLGTRMAEYYWSPEEREKVVNAIMQNNGVITNVEAILKRKNGKPVWISTNAYVRKNSTGEALSIEGLARDVTVQKELEQKLEKLALTDSLTSLPNRRALMDELHLRFRDAKQECTDLSLIFFDVNGFKKVNDHYGHLVGDNLLNHIAITLRNHVSGRSMFGRLSGDEFLFILPAYGVEKVQQFASQVYADIKVKSLQMQSQEIPFSLAIGISCLKDDDKNEYSLLDRADKAMFLAKRGEQKFELL